MDITGILEALDEETRKALYLRLWFELTIAARCIWSDSDLSDDEKVNGLKWLNEVQHRTWHAHAEPSGFAPTHYAEVVIRHLQQSRAAAMWFSGCFGRAAAYVSTLNSSLKQTDQSLHDSGDRFVHALGVVEGGSVIKVKDLLAQFVSARKQLEEFDIRDSGDYAEILVAKALGGSRNASGVERGFDVLSAEYGRVEVRSRTLPRDGRRETRIRVGEKKWNHFAWLAGVIFEPSLAVHAAYLLPHDAAKQLASGNYPRFPLEVALAHPACVNITLKLKQVEESL